MGDLGGGLPDFSLLPGVTDQEASDLSQVFASVTAECPTPTTHFAIPTDTLKELYKFVCGLLRSVGAPQWMARLVASMAVAPIAVINAILTVGITVFAPAVSALAGEGLGLIDVFRKQIDPTVAQVAVAVLNELLGTDFTADHLASGVDVASHIARAEEVGGLLHKQLMSEFQAEGDVTPDNGAIAARRMSGFLINFGTATGIIAALGGLVPAVHLDEFREIGEQVAKNLGLGRMHRQVMKPIINTLIATPYQWYLNQKFHPTQFKEGDLVNPFTQTLMDHDTIFHAMDLLGYSQDKIEKLIHLHQKRLTLSDVELFVRYEILDRSTALNMVADLGYDQDTAASAFNAEDLRRADAVLRKLIGDIETRVIDGQLTTDAFSQLLDSLPLGTYEKKFYLQTVQYKVKATHAHISFAQAQKAFEIGLWTLDQLDAYLVARGFSLDDVQTLELLTLHTLGNIAEAKKVAQFNYDAKVAKAKAKNGPIPPPPAILTS
jgi:hypothetical protein